MDRRNRRDRRRDDMNRERLLSEAKPSGTVQYEEIKKTLHLLYNDPRGRCGKSIGKFHDVNSFRNAAENWNCVVAANECILFIRKDSAGYVADLHLNPLLL